VIARRQSNHGTNSRWIYGHGLGQAESLSRGGGAGSFTHAGEQLGLAIGGVAQVSALEQASVSLFHRHARG
jgi:hypothetical protein